MNGQVLTTEERQKLLISVGTHRNARALSPLEVAELFERMRRAGADLSACAEAAQLSNTTQVSRFLRLRDLASPVQHLVDWGKPRDGLGFTVAFEIARLDDAADHELAAHAVLEHGLSSAEVRQLVQLRKRSQKTIRDCISGVLKMRPKVEVRHVFIGAVKDGKVQERLADRSQQDRDHLIAAIVSGLGLKASETKGRLGASRFTLIGGKDLSAYAVSPARDELEQRVNLALAKEVKK